MIFISILTLIVAKALPVLNTHLSSVHFTRITSLVFIFSGLLSLNSLYLESIGSGIGIYSGLFHVTQISQFFEAFIFLIGAFILTGWPTLFKKSGLSTGGNFIEGGSGKYSTDYSLIVLFSALGSSLLLSSFDLISVYLSIELQSFGLYVLATLYRNSESSTSSGLKYFLLGGLSSCLILLGIGIVYSYTGVTNFESLYLINNASNTVAFQGSDNWYNVANGGATHILGLIFIFVGFLFKIAAAPLHNWSPDVYDGTPTIVTTWLTIIPKIAILVLLLEIQTHIDVVTTLGGITTSLDTFDVTQTGYTFGDVGLIKTLLLISSVLSLIVGSLLGLAQIRIKRLLAYSTISHLGFLLLAIAINTQQSIDSFLFYMVQYTITNLNIFLILLAISYLSDGTLTKRDSRLTYSNLNNPSGTYAQKFLVSEPSLRGSRFSVLKIKDIKYISEFKGLFFSYPLLSLSLGVCLFSMAGIPPLIGFFSKQFVLFSALGNGYYFISILAIVVSVISASY